MSNLNRHPVRRAAAGVLATTLTFTGAAVAAGVTPANALAGFNFERLAGVDRYETAAAIALDDATLRNADTVVLASGGERNFPDALAGNYLAGDVRGPILLTDPARLPAATRNALTTIAPTRVVIVGGTSAVSASIEDQVRALGYTVSRLGGLDRYDTARAVAFSVNDRNKDGVQNNGSDTATVGLDAQGRRTAVLGSGQDFADILAAGPLGYARNFPVAITRPAALAAQTRAVLTDLNVDRVIIVGGTTAVSQAVEDQVRALNGGTEILRLAGQLRFETATKIAAFSYAELGFDQRHINLARSDKFADSLSGGPHAGQDRAPIVLSTPASLTPITRDFIQSRACTLVDGHIFGGTAAISAATEAAAVAAGRDARNCPAPATPTATIALPPNSTVTNRPELVSATIFQTNATGPNAGTIVRYVFDENITGTQPDFPEFHVTRFNGQRLNGADGSIDPENSRVVFVRFAEVMTTTSAGTLSVATVEQGAVADDTFSTRGADARNPAGDATLNSGTATGATSAALVAGRTEGPDLLSVDNFRNDPVSGGTRTLVDFTFDEAAFVIGQGRFVLVLRSVGVAQPQELVCTPQNGSGTTVITVTCDEGQAGDLSAANVARGYVTPGTVSDLASDVVGVNNTDTNGDDIVDAFVAAGNTNVLQAAHAGAGDGRSDTPDLSSVTLDLAAIGAAGGPSAGLPVDVATFTFDEAVVDPSAPLFSVYNDRGAVSTGDFALRSTASNNVVRVEFNDGQLQFAVGGFVVDDAVFEDTVVAGRGNAADEEGATNSSTRDTTGSTTERTAGPDLTGVAINPVRDVFGTTTNFSATYSFDEPIVNITNEFAFALFLGDGTELRAIDCVIGTTQQNGTTVNANTVTCTYFAAFSNQVNQVNQAVLGTVDFGAVNDGAVSNPEGAERTTGATSGQPQA